MIEKSFAKFSFRTFRKTLCGNFFRSDEKKKRQKKIVDVSVLNGSASEKFIVDLMAGIGSEEEESDGQGQELEFEDAFERVALAEEIGATS